MTASRYTKLCLLWLAGLLALLAITSRVVDPFWYFKDIEIQGFNKIKPQSQRYDRQFKPLILKQIRPEVVVFSSSFFEVGFNPLHSALTQNDQYKSYNFGMGAATPERVYCNVLYALNNTQLKTAVIGVVLGPMPKFDCSAQLQGMGQISAGSLLLSWAALKASVQTLLSQNRKPAQTKEGMIFLNRDKKDIVEKLFADDLRGYQLAYPDRKCKMKSADHIPQWTDTLNTDLLEGWDFLLRRLASQGVQTKLVIYPFHALLNEMELACDNASARWQYAYTLAHIVAKVNQDYPGYVELWDFQGYSDYITEPVLNNKTQYWQDAGHFNYEMGNIMLETIFHRSLAQANIGGDRFGILLTPTSVKPRFNEYFSKRQSFLNTSKSFAREFDEFITHQ